MIVVNGIPVLCASVGIVSRPHGVDVAPAARLAKELRDLLTEVRELEGQAVRESELEKRREQRRRQAAWVRDG